jgi:hypothetical protein
MNIIVGHYSQTTPDGKDTGIGYDSWVEPEDKSWILYLTNEGKPQLWTQRDADGGVTGEPLQ